MFLQKPSRSYSSDTQSIRSTKSNSSLSSWRNGIGLGISERPKSDFGDYRGNKLIRCPSRRAEQVWNYDGEEDSRSSRSVRIRPSSSFEVEEEVEEKQEEQPSRRYSTTTPIPIAIYKPRKLQKRKSASLLKMQESKTIIEPIITIIEPIEEQDELEEDEEEMEVLSSIKLRTKTRLENLIEEDEEVVEGDSIVTSPSLPSIYHDSLDTTLPLDSIDLIPIIECEITFNPPSALILPTFTNIPNIQILSSPPSPVRLIHPSIRLTRSESDQIASDTHGDEVLLDNRRISVTDSILSPITPTDSILAPITPTLITPIPIRPKLTLKKSLERLIFPNSTARGEDDENVLDEPQWRVNIRRLSQGPIMLPPSRMQGSSSRKKTISLTSPTISNISTTSSASSTLIMTPPDSPVKSTNRVHRSKSSPISPLLKNFDESLSKLPDITRIITPYSASPSAIEDSYVNPYIIPSGARTKKQSMKEATSWAMGRKESLDDEQLPLSMRALYIHTKTPKLESKSPFKKRSTALPPHLTSLHQYNPSHDLTAGLLPSPAELAKEEVLISIQSCAINDDNREMFATAGYGAISGGTFCGRVLKVGAAVTKFKKSDRVYGILESGAACEMVAVHQSLIALSPIGSTHQVALFPLALQSMEIMESLCLSLAKGSKILILANNSPAASCCLQLATYFRNSRDLWITIIIAPTSTQQAIELETFGVSELILNSPLEALKSLPSSSVDAIIDLVGSKPIYLESRRVLHDGGRFITTKETSSDGEISQWSTLKRSFNRKPDRKLISYWPVRLENPGNLLDRLRNLVELKVVLIDDYPIIKFVDSVDAFSRTGIVVIKMD